MLVKEIPQALKICLGEIGIDDEISGDAKPEIAGDANRFDSLVNVGVFNQRVEAGAGVGLQAKENVERFRERTPEL